MKLISLRLRGNFLKGKFDVSWIKKLQKGIERDIKNPSPRFKSHTVQKGVPAYLEGLLDLASST